MQEPGRHLCIDMEFARAFRGKVMFGTFLGITTSGGLVTGAGPTTGAGAVMMTTGAGAGASAIARGQQTKQHRVQTRSRITARSIAATQPSRIQPAVVGSLPQKKVAVHLAAAGPGAGARDESLCAAQKAPDAVASAAVAQPASQTHLACHSEGRHQVSAHSGPVHSKW